MKTARNFRSSRTLSSILCVLAIIGGIFIAVDATSASQGWDAGVQDDKTGHWRSDDKGTDITLEQGLLTIVAGRKESLIDITNQAGRINVLIREVSNNREKVHQKRFSTRNVKSIRLESGDGKALFFNFTSIPILALGGSRSCLFYSAADRNTFVGGTAGCGFFSPGKSNIMIGGAQGGLMVAGGGGNVMVGRSTDNTFVGNPTGDRIAAPGGDTTIYDVVTLGQSLAITPETRANLKPAFLYILQIRGVVSANPGGGLGIGGCSWWQEILGSGLGGLCDATDNRCKCGGFLTVGCCQSPPCASFVNGNCQI